jgi:hypothetical protein
MSSTLPAVHLRAGARLQAGSGSSRRVCRLDPGRVGASAGWVRVESARLQATIVSSRPGELGRLREPGANRSAWPERAATTGHHDRSGRPPIQDRSAPEPLPQTVPAPCSGERPPTTQERAPSFLSLASGRDPGLRMGRLGGLWACGWAGWAGSGPADGPAGRALGLRMRRVGGVGACGWADSAGFVLLHRPAGAERARRYRPVDRPVDRPG